MEVKIAEFLVKLITYLFVYIIIVTIAGSFRAWVAYRWGDDSAANVSMMDLNPLVHIQPFCIFFLIFFDVAIGHYGEINTTLIMAPYRRIKITCIYLSSLFIYSLCALVSLVALIATCGLSAAVQAFFMLGNDDIRTHLYLAHSYPQSSSIALMFSFIFVSTAYLSISLGIIDLLFDSATIIRNRILSRQRDAGMSQFYIELLIPYLLIIIFHGPLRWLMTSLMVVGSYGIARLVGLG
jgi:hypothetical protein